MQAALEPFHEAYASGLAQPVADFLSPVAPPHQQEGWQEGLLRYPTFHFLLSVFSITECGLDGLG
jgi:hypothetical protein